MSRTRENIVWLVSYPKSGNTWFRVFLRNLFSDSNQPVNKNELYDTPISSKKKLIDRYLVIHSSELTNEEINNLRPEVYEKISEELEELSYYKTHDAWTLNSKGKSLFPKDITRGVIYIFRNPLDVAISFSFHNNTIIDNNNFLNE